MGLPGIPRQVYDPETFAELQEIKNSSGLNWANFVLEAAYAYKRTHASDEYDDKEVCYK